MLRISRASRLALVVSGLGVALAGHFGPVTAVAPQQGERGERLAILVTRQPEGATPRYAKFEATFDIRHTRASFMHWPYDPAPPPGIPPGEGMTVDGVFMAPDGQQFRQPAFYAQQFEEAVRDGRDWYYPTTAFTWTVRFSPHQTGEWKFKIVARDRDGSAETTWRAFQVTPSASRGFIKVSRADSRYFEFDDGTFFSGVGFQLPEYLENPQTEATTVYRQLADSGVNFVRLWISSLYGSAWNPWIGGRNRYSGYLPVTGLIPFRDDASRAGTLTMRLDYERAGDSGWFDACRLHGSPAFEAVKPNTRYRVRATYQGRGISGPRLRQSPNFGFVLKVGGAFPKCYEPGTSRPVTTYGGDTAGWGEIEGVWNSGNRSFMPKLHLALENVIAGAAYVRSLSVREIRPDGTDGPEVLGRPSMEHHMYIPQARAHAFDKIVRLAETNGVYLKLVVLEKGDEMYLKMDDNGDFVTAADNQNGVYGTGRTVNRTRWLQQAWWRYLQARWGYSPSIHSWELLNEGDPASRRHYELADEFGKFMHFGVFGADPASRFDHPNDHLVTTSFWHSFPADFWRSPAYPHVDYADLHAYVSTSQAPQVERERMQWDSAHYHTWHSQQVAAARVGKPVVRGEAGLDAPGRQDERVLGLQRDLAGVWLHNFLWSGLDSGGLYELYWWRSHIWNSRADHRRTYRLVNRFLSELDLNKGGYGDWDGSVSSAAIRVVGQKNVKNGSMHLWIQNSGHTWKNAAESRSIEPVSGDIRIPGFSPGRSYQVEWWDTHADEKTILEAHTVRASASGDVVLTVRGLATDTALTMRAMSGSTPARD